MRTWCLWTWHELINLQTRGSESGAPLARIPSEAGHSDANPQDYQASDTTDLASETTRDETDDAPTTPSYGGATPSTSNEEPPKQRRPAKGSEPFEKWEREEMEKLLGQLNGQLGKASLTKICRHS